jgi:hypothetical protein
LSMTICMRAAPSKDQAIADSLAWSETLRATSVAGVDPTMQFVEKIYSMPAFGESAMRGGKPLAKLLQQCKDWGLRWNGKAIEKQNMLAIQSIMPFCREESALSAIGDVKRSYAEIDKLTTLSKICKATETFIKGSFLISELQEGKATSSRSTSGSCKSLTTFSTTTRHRTHMIQPLATKSGLSSRRRKLSLCGLPVRIFGNGVQTIRCKIARKVHIFGHLRTSRRRAKICPMRPSQPFLSFAMVS